MRTSYFLLLPLFFLMINTAEIQAQSSGKLKSANQKMEMLDYMGAIAEYNQILSKNADISEAKIKLAECYRKISDTENAEYWYGQVVRLPEAEPIHYLYYGYMLQRNGKCDMAREWFAKYVEAVPDDTRGRHLLRACDYEEELEKKNNGIYEVTHMPFNTGLDDFSAMTYGDGVVFASESADQGPMKRLHCWTGNPFLELMYVEREDQDSMCNYEYGDPEKFSSKLNSKYHDAVIAHDNENNMLYFTRNNIVNGKGARDDEGVIRLKILSAEGSGDGSSASFSNIEDLPFNSDEYSTAHPALSPDGKYMYFASDMPGGFGGMDLYVSEQGDGRWGPPVNLGPKINTEGHEVFPFFGYDNLLYFASDGHVGMGGLDVYHVEKKEEDGFEWGEIVNIGAPINSRDDDFSYIINEEKTFGYFTSDREGGFGDDDIYSFCRKAAPIEILVYDEKTEEPIEGAEVVNDCTGETLLTDAEGKVTIEQKLDQCCTFSASKESYEENSKEGCTGSVPGEGTLVEIPLSRPTPECLVQGVVTDQSSGLALSGIRVVLESEECGTIDMITSENGSYLFTLAENCCYKVSIPTTDPYLAYNSASELCTSNADGTAKDPCQYTQNIALVPFRKTITDTGTGTTTGTSSEGRTLYTCDGTPVLPGQPGPPGKALYASPPPGGCASVGGGTITHVTETPPVYPPTGGGHIDPTIYPPTGGSGWDKTTIESQAGNLDPVICCGVYDNPGSAYGTLEESRYSYTDGKKQGDPLSFLLHIYYDFDQSYIRADAEPELTKLLGLLQENPSLVVEIGSHTDSRGSYKYNDRLSSRRAEAVVRWLKNKGISSNQLKAVGYGETTNVNNCTNNVPCSEQEHQMNRRTEFRVVGLIDGTTFQSSLPRSGVTGKYCEGCPF